MTPKKVRIALALLALGVAAYFGATVGVRRWVDRRLEATHGRVLDFELTDTGGKTWRSADLRGRTVVLNFFRSHCEGCLAERDAVRALAERLEPGRAVLLGVMMDAVEGFSPDDTARTLERMDFRHPVVMADAAFVDQFHGTTWAHVTPTTFVADPQGRVTRHLRGHQTLAALCAALPAEALKP